MTQTPIIDSRNSTPRSKFAHAPYTKQRAGYYPTLQSVRGYTGCLHAIVQCYPSRCNCIEVTTNLVDVEGPRPRIISHLGHHCACVRRITAAVRREGETRKTNTCAQKFLLETQTERGLGVSPFRYYSITFFVAWIMISDP